MERQYSSNASFENPKQHPLPLSAYPRHWLNESAASLKHNTKFEKSPDENINTEVQTVESNENAVDASANIISNFAKMFAKEEAAIQQNKITTPENNINLLGDGSKTIEDIVCSVIRQIIADEVSTNWHKSADYENFAKQEISLYTQKWIDKNLPTIVEKIVKQEIERVMAKAGNNQ